MAKTQLNADKVIVFGSRARGDFQKVSDVDLAFYFPENRSDSWSRFCVEVEESLPTLLSLDLLNARTISKDFLDRIEKEGITIYDKNSPKNRES